MSTSQSQASSEFAARLLARFGSDIVTVGDAIPQRNWGDWSGLDPVKPLALARPRTTEDVAAILKFCNDHGAPVAPQGGLTGLAGGGRPEENGVALSLERMTAIEEVDPVMATMTVQAGAPLAACQAAAEQAGLFLGLDLGARGSCSIGGNLSTNAGGNRVIRFGMAREHVLGIEVALADGTIIRSLNKLLKNNAGYDLKQLFIGSEGTLGVITRCVLKLQPPAYFASALCATPDFAAMLELLKALRAAIGPGLTSFEVMWPSFYDFMAAKLKGVKRPFAQRHGAYALIEISGFDQERDLERLQEKLADMMERGVVSDAIVAQSEREARELWAVREGVSEYSQILGPITAFDLGLNLSRSGAFVEEMDAALTRRWPDVIALSYGHIGDSNLHLVVHVPSAGAHQPHDEIVDMVFAAVGRAGGTISAEHGVGLAKKPYLGLTRTPEELDVMARVKRALDPNNIINPGKVLTL